tara:strand:+ start:550 stop:1590 length:1041 start_codon:yes stop_codon:yes gene_type:complete
MHGLAQTKDEEWMTAWAGNTPWHRLGTKTDGLMTSQEALKKAHLDWQVEKLPLRYVDTNGLVSTVPETYGVFRNDGEKYVPLTRNGKAVGKVWKAWQNVDALSFIDELFQTHEGKIEVCGALGNGERVWVLARMPNNIVLDGVDTINQFLLISNCHDGTGSVVIMLTPIRVVCQNTLNMALQSGSDFIWRIRHTGKKDTHLQKVLEIFAEANESFFAWGEQAAQLLDIEMSLDEAKEYFIDTLQLKRNKETDNLATRGQGMLNKCVALLAGENNKVGDMEGTAWAAYNAVTEYIDHHATELRNGDKSIKRMESALFGPLARRKQAAWKNAFEDYSEEVALHAVVIE